MSHIYTGTRQLQFPLVRSTERYADHIPRSWSNTRQDASQESHIVGRRGQRIATAITEYFVGPIPFGLLMEKKLKRQSG